MNTAEIDLMERAAKEIRFLRGVNNHQGARLKMFDDLMSVLNTRPPNDNNGSAVGMDVARELERVSEAAREANK